MWADVFKSKTLKDYDPNLSREEIIRRGRILIIDDEKPVLLDALKKAGFSVDYDPSGNDCTGIERQLYDLVLLDFSGVGENFGKDHGLALLRHIKRTAPGTRILAFTSKALMSNQSDFFRLSDGILRKDAGLQESLETIENALKDSFRIQNLWHAVLEVAGIKPTSTDAEALQKALIKAIKRRDAQLILKALAKQLGKAAQGGVETGLKKLCTAVGIPWI